jgi:peptidoglycan hydrolase CwlO-like protein
VFRKVAQGFTNAATKPGCLGPFQRSLPQQEPASLNAYESNDRNVTGLSYKKNTTKVQQLETFSTQYTGILKFLLGRIPAGGSSGIAKPSLGGDVQFKKLGDIARLNLALCHSKSQPVGFGTSQQTVKNILAEGEKSDILSGIWGLIQNPINNSFREGKMVNKNEQGAEKSQQPETLKSENEKLKDENQQLGALKSENESQIKDLQKQLESKSELESKIQDLQTQLENEKLKGQNQQLEELKSANEELNTKLQGSESKNKELESKIQDLQTQLESKDEELKDENNTLKTKLQESESKNKELESKAQELEELKSANEGKIQQLESRVEELEALKSENEELKGEIQQLEALKSENEKLKGEIQQLEVLKNANEELNTKLQESENKIQKLEALKSENESQIQQLESRVKELEVLKSANESQIKDLQEQLESKNKELEDDKNSKPPAVNVQGVKSKVNYASASFILSWVCAVGASLATPYLAMCATLAVAASVFLALGCYCLYKANTALSNVEVDQQDNQQLLESSL